MLGKWQWRHLWKANNLCHIHLTLKIVLLSAPILGPPYGLCPFPPVSHTYGRKSALFTLGGIALDVGLSMRTAGQSWAKWGNAYLGKVYALWGAERRWVFRCPPHRPIVNSWFSVLSPRITLWVDSLSRSPGRLADRLTPMRHNLAQRFSNMLVSGPSTFSEIIEDPSELFVIWVISMNIYHTRN